MSEIGDKIWLLGSEVEFLAGNLWRRENPKIGVFECDAKTKDEYRERVLDDALNEARLAIDEYYNGDRQEALLWLVCAYAANQKRADARRPSGYEKSQRHWDIDRQMWVYPNETGHEKASGHGK